VISSNGVNFEVPDSWGIGKHVVSEANLSVSRGFGTVKRCVGEQCQCQWTVAVAVAERVEKLWIWEIVKQRVKGI